MPSKVFLTGATGYIGGDILHHLSSQNLDVSFALLVRSQEKASKILEQYPGVESVGVNLKPATEMAL